MILYTRSIPTETPTQGTWFLLWPAASLNMPTRLSYRPPPAIEPTPTEFSSTSSDFDFLGLDEPAAGGAGGAEAVWIAS